MYLCSNNLASLKQIKNCLLHINNIVATFPWSATEDRKRP